MGLFDIRSNSEAREEDRSLDTLAATVRAVTLDDDDEEVARAGESWALHLLTLTPPPGLTGRFHRRDFAGALSFIRSTLSARRGSAQKLMGDLRQVVATITVSLQSAFADDAAADNDLRAVIEQLRQAAERSPPDQLRLAALQTTRMLSERLNDLKSKKEVHARRMSDELLALRQELEDARRQGETDGLTGLPNRRAFDAALQEAQLACDIFGESSCLILVDLDHFKQVNDTYGHATGDAVLREVARRLSSSFPSRRDCAARFGGEEMAVVLRGADAENALRLAHRFGDNLRRDPIVAGTHTLHVTASLGVALLTRGGSAAQIIDDADRALYRAKRDGRDRTVMG